MGKVSLVEQGTGLNDIVSRSAIISAILPGNMLSCYGRCKEIVSEQWATPVPPLSSNMNVLLFIHEQVKR